MIMKWEWEGNEKSKKISFLFIENDDKFKNEKKPKDEKSQKGTSEKKQNQNFICSFYPSGESLNHSNVVSTEVIALISILSQDSVILAFKRHNFGRKKKFSWWKNILMKWHDKTMGPVYYWQ